MNWFRRIWGSVRFAALALAYHWRHGPKSALTSTDAPKPPPTLDEFVAAVERVLEREQAAVPLAAPAVRALAPTVNAHGPPARCTSAAPFWVRGGSGDTALTYEGDKGAAARRLIEVLRREGSEWAAYRTGQLWDWGPRE